MPILKNQHRISVAIKPILHLDRFGVGPPYLFQAGTDSFAWRSRGVPVYGIYPYPISAEDLKRMHGNDERVSIESLRRGTEMIYRTLVAVAGRTP